MKCSMCQCVLDENVDVIISQGIPCQKNYKLFCLDCSDKKVAEDYWLSTLFARFTSAVWNVEVKAP